MLKFLFRLFIFGVFAVKANAGVPLPNQQATQDKGLSAGFGFGAVSHAVCKTMWNWQGKISYTYKPHLSGGIGINFFGGNLDSTNNLIVQRYIISGEYIYNKPNYALFIGPIFTFDNMDIRELYKNWQKEKIKIITECDEVFGAIGSSAGFHSGVGYLITEDFGFNLGHKLFFTYKGNLINSFSGAIAFNVRNYIEQFLNNTKNFWLSAEYYAIFINSSEKTIHTLLLGFNLGF